MAGSEHPSVICPTDSHITAFTPVTRLVVLEENAIKHMCVHACVCACMRGMYKYLVAVMTNRLDMS